MKSVNQMATERQALSMLSSFSLFFLHKQCSPKQQRTSHSANSRTHGKELEKSSCECEMSKLLTQPFTAWLHGTQKALNVWVEGNKVLKVYKDSHS